MKIKFLKITVVCFMLCGKPYFKIFENVRIFYVKEKNNLILFDYGKRKR